MENNISNILALAKKCLSILSTSTAKDDEIKMLIDSAIKDMERIGITVDLTNPMHQDAIIRYVKSGFGMLDENTKQKSYESYCLLCSSLQVDAITEAGE